jgi:NADH-quinone oxidoreductase subunit J
VLTLAQDATVAPILVVAPVMFYAFAALVVLSAWAIVLSQNIVRMSVYLLLTLAGAAGLYFMLAAEFLAAVQLIVYVGGTLILIIFGVMLTSKNPFLQFVPKSWEVFVAVGLAIVLMGLVLLSIVGTTFPEAQRAVPLSGATATVEGYSQVEWIGRALLSSYMLPFEIAAVLLLVVMIGAAFMARKRNKEQAD